MPGATGTADVPGVEALGSVFSSPGLTGASAAGAYVVAAGQMLRAANTTSLIAAEREIGASAASEAARLERFTKAYLRSARSRVSRGVRDALRLPEKAEALRAAEAALREAENSPARLPSVIEARRVRVTVIRSSGSPRQEALHRVVRSEQRYVRAHVLANAGRARGAAKQAALKASSNGGARWVLGDATEHTEGCLALAGKALPHSVLDHVRPPMHYGCTCYLMPLKDGQSALAHKEAVALAKKALELEGQEHGGAFEDRLAPISEGLGPSGFLDVSHNPKLSAAASRRHRLHGRFANEGGGLRPAGPAARPATADAALATARGAQPNAQEVLKPRDWTDPPAPTGKLGEGKAGGYSSDKAFGTNTSLGRVGEAAFVRIVGGRVIHPPGRGEQSPLDVHFDGYGFEVKAVSRKATSIKATPKPFEREQKEAFAKELGVKAALAIVVVDSDAGKAHAYFRDGMQGGRLSKKTGWRYLGSTDLVDERAAAEKVAERFDPTEPRDFMGRWQGHTHDFGRDDQAAITALGQGERVELDEPREVGTMLDDLAARVADAKAKGEDAPLYNLCEVSVKGTNLFCSRSEDIPRLRMPQLGGFPLPGSKAAAMVPPGKFADLTNAFIDDLRSKGVKVTSETDRADMLKATQNELNGAKVSGMVGVLERGGRLLGSEDPVVVSRDGYIVDGHHRWAAQVGFEARSGHDVMLPVARVDLPIREVLRLANAYSAEMGLPQQGAEDAQKQAFEGFDPGERRDAHGRWAKGVDVSQIESWDDAVRLMRDKPVVFMPKLGEGGVEPNGETAQQVVRAVTEAIDRYPILTKKTSSGIPLAVVDQSANLPDGVIRDSASRKGVWAMTYEPPGSPPHSTIYINNFVNVDGGDVNINDAIQTIDGSLAPSDLGPYGLTLHELGHAYANALGFGPLQLAELLRSVGLTPRAMGSFTKYGASSPAEAFGEVFSMATAPEADSLAYVQPDVAVKIKAAMAKAKAREEEVLHTSTIAPAASVAIGGAELEDALLRAEANIAADAWLDDEAFEGLDFERLHPRAHGRFRQKPHVDLASGVRAPSVDVSKINSWDDAVKFMHDRPEPIEFEPKRGDGGETPDANTARNITRAVVEMADRYPILTSPGLYPHSPLTRVDHVANTDGLHPVRESAAPGIWALTGAEYPHGYGTPETRIYLNSFAYDETEKIGLNQTDVKAAHTGALAPSDSTTYGMMLHELGHAYAHALGLTPSDMREILSADGLSPRAIGRFSKYGASTADEAFGEVFAMANTPGALDLVPHRTAVAITSVMDKLQQRADWMLAHPYVHPPEIPRAPRRTWGIRTIAFAGAPLDEALRRAEANMETDEWPVEGLGEDAEFERLHPRAHGRFRAKPHLDLAKGVAAVAAAKPSISKIQSWDDAVEFMRDWQMPDHFSDLEVGDRIDEMGQVYKVVDVESDGMVVLDDGTRVPPSARTRKIGPDEPPRAVVSFKPKRGDGGETPDGETARQVTQAVTEAIERYPILTTKNSWVPPLVAVDQVANLPKDNPTRIFGGQPGVWAVTNYSYFEPRSTVYLNNFASDPDNPDEKLRDFKLNATDISAVHEGILAPSDANPYGLTMHEMGHAYANALGVSRGSMRNMLNASGLTPGEAKNISRYAAASPDESFGEIFSMANVPGALDRVPAETAAKIKTVMGKMHDRERWMLEHPYDQPPIVEPKDVGDGWPYMIAVAGPALADALRRADVNIAADDWVELGDAEGLGEDFDFERKHHRGPAGRFIRSATGGHWYHTAPVARRDSIEANGLVPRSAGAVANFPSVFDDPDHIYLWPSRDAAVEYAKRLSVPHQFSQVAPHAGEGHPYDVYEVKLPTDDIAPDHAAFFSEVFRPYLHHRWLAARGNTRPLAGTSKDLLDISAGGTSVRDFIDSHLDLARGYRAEDPVTRFQSIDDRAADALPMLSAMPPELRAALAEQMASRGFGVMAAPVDAGHVKRVGTYKRDVAPGERRRPKSNLSEAIGGYLEHLHPRDPRGRWRHKPIVLMPIHQMRGEPVSIHGADAWRKDPRVVGGELGRPKHYDPDIDAIDDGPSAERVLAKMGIEADFTLPAGAVADGDYFKDVVQATRDMTKRFPSLREGEYRLGRIRMARTSDDDGAIAPNVDATTGPNTANHGNAAWKRVVGLAPGGGMKWGFADGPTTMTLNPFSTIGLMSHGMPTDDGGPGMGTIYGMVVHELGHAVDTASGLEFSRGPGYRYGSAERDLLNETGLTPRVIDRFSHYGASGVFESFAEVFATLNTPGALDVLPPDLQQTLLAARKKINAQWPTPLL